MHDMYVQSCQIHKNGVLFIKIHPLHHLAPFYPSLAFFGPLKGVTLAKEGVDQSVNMLLMASGFDIVIDRNAIY